MKKKLICIFLLILILPLSFSGDIITGQDNKDIIQNNKGEEEYRMERLAIVVGINDYLDDKVTNLKYAVSDAEKMAKVLEEKGIFDVQLITNDSGKYPTKNNIISALEDANYLASKNIIKSFVFYFSGHGFQQDNVNYLAPMEINPASLKTTAINMDRVLQIIDDIQKEAKVMVFMDACRNDPRKSTAFGEGFSRDRESHGYGIFYSTSPNDYSWEVPELDGGVYSYFLIKALQGEADVLPIGNEDGYVSFREAVVYVTNEMRIWSKDNPKMEQLPWEKTSKSGEFYITIADTKPDINIIKTDHSIDYSPEMPPVGDQGSIGSVVGWTVGYYIKSYQEHVDRGWEYNDATLCSPSYIYNLKNDGSDMGMSFEDAFDILLEEGCLTLKEMPYTLDYTKDPPRGYNDVKEMFKIKSYNKLTLTNKYRGISAEGIDNIKKSLINNGPVAVGINGPANFHGITNDDYILEAHEINDESYGGGFSQVIVGYDDYKRGGAFKLLNSWGKDWADGGYCWITYEVLEEIGISAYEMIDIKNGRTKQRY